MKRLTTIGIVAVLAGSLGVAGTGIAKPDLPKPNQVAAKLCKAEKHADKAAFKATYGKHAMRECKRANRAQVGDTIRNASQQCKADREADPVAFAEAWGSNPNAHGKCVSATVREQAVDEAVEEFRERRPGVPGRAQRRSGGVCRELRLEPQPAQRVRQVRLRDGARG